jgi:hypothetical protein
MAVGRLADGRRRLLRVLAEHRFQVAGLPIANFAPGASSQLQLRLSPMFDETASFSESVSLLIGGYSGGQSGDVSAEADFDVSGSTVSGPM